MAIWGEKKAIPAILGASGITENQAKTCLYYAIATYFLPDEVDIMPILAIIGPQGTGKSSLLEQLKKIVNEPRLIGARTPSGLRDMFGKTTTALLDDADDINDEKMLINRYSKLDSVIEHKVNKGGCYWVTRKTDVFGATIITKRLSFKDAAVTSRSIVIKTKHISGKYKLTRFRNAHKVFREKAAEIDLKEMGEETSHRIEDNWMPLRAVARYLKDKAWLKYSDKQIVRGKGVLHIGQSYEPEQATLLIFKEKTEAAKLSTGKTWEKAIVLKDIKEGLRGLFDINLKVIQIGELLQGLGFKVIRPSGYPKVRIDEKLLNKLLKKYK